MVSPLRTVPGTTLFLHAEGTAVLCTDSSIQDTRERAYATADAPVQWAQQNKMFVAGEKTQLLVLSLWARDSAAKSMNDRRPGRIEMAGISLDRLLHFGIHSQNLHHRVRPCNAQLRSNRMRLGSGETPTEIRGKRLRQRAS